MNFDVSVLGALIPVFFVILTGFVLRWFQFPGDEFWSRAERLTYFILFPLLLFQKIASASLGSQSVSLMVIVLCSAVFIMAGLLLYIKKWWSSGGPAFTSFFQGSIRFNSYVGLAATFALFGDSGLTIAAIAMTVLIPLLNILCVTVLILFNDQNKGSLQTIFRELIRNPLIIACTSGMLLNFTGIGLHPVVEETLSIFGRAALPIGLLCVGAAVDIAAARNSGKIVAFSSALKLIVFPFLMWTLCNLLRLDPQLSAIAVLFAALPGSPAAYILSRQLGGDSPLLAGIITVQIVAAMVTFPLVMALLAVS
jgi:malonate transporter